MKRENVIDVIIMFLVTCPSSPSLPANGSWKAAQGRESEINGTSEMD